MTCSSHPPGGGDRSMALGEGGDHGVALPLIADQPKHGGGGGIVRSGSMWTASAHVITAVIGSGVLSLAWSIAQLGWVAGPAAMLVFAAVTALQSTLFADCYRSPDTEHGAEERHVIGREGAECWTAHYVGTSCGTFPVITIQAFTRLSSMANDSEKYEHQMDMFYQQRNSTNESIMISSE